MDTAQYLKQLADAEKKQKRTELDQARANALTQIGREEALVKPAYQKQRQQASTQSQLGAKNLAEFWSRRGQTQSGISQQAELSRQNTLGNQLGEIGTAENTALTNLSNQRLDTQTAYNQNLESAYTGIQNNLNKNLYSERLRQEELARQAEEARRQEALKIAEINAANYRASIKQSASREGKINKFEGLTLNYQTGLKGVPSGNKMIYSIPQQDGSITQIKLDKGVNPFTGTTNNDAYRVNPVNGKKELVTFSNGYQPKYIKNKKVSSVGTTTYNGQKQSIWADGKSGNSKLWLWDGKLNKYIPYEG